MRNFKSYLIEAMAGAMNINNMSTFLKYLEGNRREKFTNAVNSLTLAMDKGEIYNAEYTDIKSALSYAIYDGFNKLNDSVRNILQGKDYGNYREISDYLYHIQYPTNLSAGLKKINAAIKASGELPELVEAAKVYNELLPISDALNYLKTRTIKGRKPNPNAAPKFVPKVASPADLKLIDEKLREITKTVRARQIENLETQITRIFARFLNAVKSGDKEVVEAMRKDPQLNFVIFRTFDRDYTPLPDYKKTITKMATDNTDAMLNQYIGKNLKKLSGIVSAKGSLADIKVFNIEVNPYSISSEMQFRFADKARFVVNNKIVWVYNNRGTTFCRFPTTFHDVVLSNGQKMKYPSEEKMNKDFCK